MRERSINAAIRSYKVLILVTPDECTRNRPSTYSESSGQWRLQNKTLCSVFLCFFSVIVKVLLNEYSK